MEKKPKIFLWIGISMISPSLMAQVTFGPLEIFPPVLMTYEDASVRFTLHVDCLEKDCPKGVELVQWEQDGKEAKSRWQLRDDGFYGDSLAGDRIYSRSVAFKESRPGTLKFSVAPTNYVTLDITPRPSFLEILQRLWEKWRSLRGTK